MADNNNNTENQLQYQNANNILVVQEVYQVDVEYTIQVEKNKTEKEKKYKKTLIGIQEMHVLIHLIILK